MRALSLSDQGSNLDFLESKSSVLPVTPSDNFPAGYAPFGSANVLLEKFEAKNYQKNLDGMVLPGKRKDLKPSHNGFALRMLRKVFSGCAASLIPIGVGKAAAPP